MASLIEENWLLDIPSFSPQYDHGVDYGYKNRPGENLEALLRKTSKNHCMYCYSLLRNDRVNIVNNPVPVSLLSGDRKPQIRFLGNHHSGSGNLYHKSFRM